MKTITQRFFSTKGRSTLKAFVLLFMFAMGSQSSYGQLLTWLTVNNAGTETSEPSTSNNSNLSAASLSLGSGVTAAGNTNRFGGSSWELTLANSITQNDFIQFTVTPKAGTAFTATSLEFIWDRSTTGPDDVTLRSSNDNYGSNLGSVTGMSASTTTIRTITISGLTNITAATTFRLYGYGGTNATTGTGGFDCANGRTTPNVTLNGSTTVLSTTWTTSWSNSAPINTVDAIINGTYATGTNGPIDAKSLTINASRTLTVNSTNSVTVQNAVVNNGTLTIENNANLIQVNNVANTGSATVNRNGGDLKRLDYALWSSPVSGRRLIDFSSLTTPTRFYTYNPGSNKYTAATNTNTFTAATGYLIRMPDVLALGEGANLTNYYKGLETLSYPGVFTGTLNNGNYSVVTTANTYNAVGNPYPSTISADSFITANSITDGLYFWRKTNGASGTAYARYTAMGGAGTTAGNGGITPNGTIQVGQGFIVKATGSSLVFNNAMRLGTASTQFFKTKAQAEKSRIWLNLNNAEGMINQTLVGYMEGATLAIDNGIDGKSFGDGEIELASNIDGESYTIQGRPAFDATDVVALNFKTSVAGTFNIAIDKVDGLFSKGQDIYLVDKTTGTTTNLNEGAYSFNAEAGVDNTRFTLTYQKTLKIDAPLFNENSVLVSRSNGTLNVKSSAVAINNVKVFDVQGRLVAERKNVKSNTASFSNLKANQVLIVKVTSESNAVVTKKVLN